MFAKPKPVDDQSPTTAPKKAVDVAQLLLKLRQVGPLIWLILKKPYMAPLMVLALFLISISVFLAVSGGENNASPSVRVSLAREKPRLEANHETKSQPMSGLQAFGMDSSGLIPEASAQNFAGVGDDSGAAVITIAEPGTDAQGSGSAAHFPSSPLATAPIAGLAETTPDGPLPVISAQGVTVSSAYARPFKSDGRPMVALIIGGLGLNPAATKAAIQQLPPEVTLSFVPYASGLQDWINQARAHGHEVLIEVPMQPVNYPDNDPGPQTLMAHAPTDELIAKLNWSLSRATGYFGIIIYQGSAFLKDRPGVATFAGVLKTRGVSFIDDGAGRDVGGAWGRASSERAIDAQITKTDILNQLNGLEQSARTHAQALGTGFAYPVTIGTVMAWAQALNGRGIQLAPASAVTHR